MSENETLNASAVTEPKPGWESLDTKKMEKERAEGWRCSYCSRDFRTSPLPGQRFENAGRFYCNDLEWYIFRHDGRLTDAQRDKNEADVKCQRELDAANHRAAQERDEKQRTLERQLRENT